MMQTSQTTQPLDQNQGLSSVAVPVSSAIRVTLTSRSPRLLRSSLAPCRSTAHRPTVAGCDVALMGQLLGDEPRSNLSVAFKVSENSCEAYPWRLDTCRACGYRKLGRVP